MREIDFGIASGYLGAPTRNFEVYQKNDDMPPVELGLDECKVKVCFNQHHKSKNPTEFAFSIRSGLRELRVKVMSVLGHYAENDLHIRIFSNGSIIPNTFQESLKSFGVKEHSTVLCLCTHNDTIQELKMDLSRGLLDRTRGFDEELDLLKKRNDFTTKHTPRDRSNVGGFKDWGFKSIEPLEINPLTGAPYDSPSSSEALALLQRLATDPGIKGIMKKYKWQVGKLTEIPPTAETGFMGLSDHCLLGLNKNQGQVLDFYFINIDGVMKLAFHTWIDLYFLVTQFARVIPKETIHCLTRETI